MRLDFGSGYNPKTNFKTCDFNSYCDYFSDDKNIFIEDNSVKILRMKNVIHHLKNLNDMILEFKRICKKNSYIVIIEPSKKFFKQNLILDYIWYRYIIPRYEIWFSCVYRDFLNQFLENGFELVKKRTINEKEIFLFTLINK